MDKEIIGEQVDGVKTYYIPADDLEKINDNELNKYKQTKYTTFQQYKKSFNIWCLKIKVDDAWSQGTCNCPAFTEDYICKHVIGMGYSSKTMQTSSSSKKCFNWRKAKERQTPKNKRSLDESKTY